MKANLQKKGLITVFKPVLLCVCLTYTSCERESDSIFKNNIEYQFSDIEEMPIDQIQEMNQWETTGWGVYEDIIINGTNILYDIEHDETSFSSRTLKTEITGGDRYNNVFFTNTIAKQWEELDWYFNDAKIFEYNLEFFPDVGINCEMSDLSEVEGFEFTAQHVIIPNSWGWGIQWSKTNTWSYWNDEKVNGEIIGWENLYNIDACIFPNEWNTIKIIGTINNDFLSYDRLEINSEVFNINVSLNMVEVPEGWSENFIQVGFQINGNDAIRTDHNHGVDPVKVYLDNLNLKISN